MLRVRQQADVPSLEKVMELAKTSLQQGIVSDGPLCREFEKQLADYCGYKYCCVVSSGTVALMYAFHWCKDELIDMPSFTWISTPGAASWADRIVRFRDVHDAEWTIDDEIFADGAQTICAVWPFGIRPDAINSSAAFTYTIGDCAQALGSDITGCDVACLSFSYSKVLTTGEGGACLTNNEYYAKEIRDLRDNGKLGPDEKGNIQCKLPGFTGRMTEIQAAMGIVGMESLGSNISKRGKVACGYGRGLSGLLDPRLQNASPNGSYFPIRLKERDKLWSGLREKGIDARKYFSPCHKMAAYNTGQTLPVTEMLAQEVMTLPIYAGMPDEDVSYVIEAVKGILS